MRQPKFKLGEKVKTEVAALTTFDLRVDVEMQGTIVGINYNIKDGSSGSPFYQYTLFFSENSAIKNGFNEEKLVEIDNE